MKINTSQALVIALQNLKNPFEVETNASGYVMGAIFKEEGSYVIILNHLMGSFSTILPMTKVSMP